LEAATWKRDIKSMLQTTYMLEPIPESQDVGRETTWKNGQSIKGTTHTYTFILPLTCGAFG